MHNTILPQKCLILALFLPHFTGYIYLRSERFGAGRAGPSGHSGKTVMLDLINIASMQSAYAIGAAFFAAIIVANIGSKLL